MILNDYLTISITNRNVTYYKNKGYDCKSGSQLCVSINDLVRNCQVIEDRQCDVCGQVYSRPHADHVTTFDRFGKDVCPHCFKTNSDIKKEVQDKREKTCLKKFGVVNPMFLDEEVEKIQKIMLEKYGKPNAQQVDQFKLKQEETMRKLYGAPKALQVKEFKEKFVSTITSHDNIKTSSQQIYCYNLLKENGYDVQLNAPFSTCALDVLINMSNGVKIDLEYDGLFWHNKHLASKERRRDEFLKSNGFKIIRIKSFKKLPTLEQIQESIDYVTQPSNTFSCIYLEDANKNNN